MDTWILRFDPSEISYWADQYPATDTKDVPVIEAGQRARQSGYYTMDDFLAVNRWKTNGRSDHHCRRNTPEAVQAATQQAFSVRDEKQRVKILLSLHGTGYPTASALLHLSHEDRYPVLDFHALGSLGVHQPRSYNMDFWLHYLQVCRSLAKQCGVKDMRTLDRALWAYDKANPFN